jgi:hypothetical protein
MTVVKISLAIIDYAGLRESKINPFWFTTDNAIRLFHSQKRTSVNVILDKLSERSLLEVSASFRLGLIQIKEESVFFTFLNARDRKEKVRTMQG